VLSINLWEISSFADKVFALKELHVSDNPCLQTNVTIAADKDRVKAISAIHPDCGCEGTKTSHFSPGIVENKETLTRFVFSPVHTDRKGNIKPSVFSHVSTFGCSVQREDIANDEELISFITKYRDKNANHNCLGVLTASCSSLRNIKINNAQNRIVCVYDTSEEDNPAHAEIHQSQHVITDADLVELRAKLFEIFTQKNLQNYREGVLLNSIVK